MRPCWISSQNVNFLSARIACGECGEKVHQFLRCVANVKQILKLLLYFDSGFCFWFSVFRIQGHLCKQDAKTPDQAQNRCFQLLTDCGDRTVYNQFSRFQNPETFLALQKRVGVASNLSNPCLRNWLGMSPFENDPKKLMYGSGEEIVVNPFFHPLFSSYSTRKGEHTLPIRQWPS
ncbi:hypothetical protein CDAR_304161 [Caerostris darwini]|uniref:Uncharacterized protein n=1 Tax=Caerostris darwini TaxID=1538125 RepID=A0AAV4WC49_9ARAC|nr:hypothetical protein CDAR_304161 [Caerostris darwini]